MFDADKSDLSKSIQIDNTSVECIYDVNKKETGLCVLCNSTLVIMEEGFPTCTNPSCSVICTDTLDYSPEWRFYGADDKNSSDPTRCGNPINPLLIESSFGCKVMHTSNLSHEMKNICKWIEWQSMPHRENLYIANFNLLQLWLKTQVFLKYLLMKQYLYTKIYLNKKCLEG